MCIGIQGKVGKRMSSITYDIGVVVLNYFTVPKTFSFILLKIFFFTVYTNL